MPYTLGNPPDYIKNLPKGAQKLFIVAFNSAYDDTGDDDKARIAGWSNVKRKYKKVGDKWVKKSLSINVDGVVAYDNLPDDVIELPGNTPKVWMKIFNGSIKKGLGAPLARTTAWNAVKKYIYQAPHGIWRFKKQLTTPERIIFTKLQGEKEIMKLQKFIPRKSSKKDGYFKIFIPFDSKDGTFIIKATDDNKKYLKGVASATIVDREDDKVESSFIKKMHQNAMGLPVFLDHKHDSEHLVGTIVKTEGDDDYFIPTTQLEDEWSSDDPTGNIEVNRLLKRLDSGLKLGYSIGGKITSAVKHWNNKLNKFVRHILDGEIMEVSVTPIAALQGSDVSLTFVKNLNDDMFADFDEEIDEDLSNILKEIDIDPKDAFETLSTKYSSIDEVGEIGLQNLDDESVFWMDFEKAIKKYIDLSQEQPPWENVDVSKLSRTCFARVPNAFDKSTWEHPYKWLRDGKQPEVHLEALDKAFFQLKQNKPVDTVALAKVISAREQLGVGEKIYKFIDFRKLLAATLAESVDARQARFRMYDILDAYSSAIYQVVWHDEMDVDEKVADIGTLTNQLIDELKTLADDMAKEIVVTTKRMSLK